MKSLITSLFALLVVASTYAQQQPIKSETISYLNGKATYQYYENPQTAEIVKHGTFNYTESQKGKFGTQTINVKGQFKDGLREGTWSTSIQKVDAENQLGTYTTQSFSSTQNYKSGLPNGVWSLNSTLKTRDRTYVNMQEVWGAFESPLTESLSITFKDGVLVGAASLTRNGVKSSYNLTQEGFITGEFAEELSGVKTEMAFNAKGVMTKYVERIPATGTVLKKIDFDADLLQTVDKYINGEIGKKELSDANIKSDTINGFLDEIKFLIEDDYLTMVTMGGDKTINSKGSYRTYGRYMKFQRIEIVPYESHSKWPRKYYGYTDSKSQIQSYKDFLTNYGKEISKEDYSTVQRLIANLENELNNASKQQTAQKEYTSLYNQIEQLQKIPEKKATTDGLSPYNTNTHVYTRSISKSIGNYNSTAKTLFFKSKYSNDDFLYNGYKAKQNDYVASVLPLKEYTSFLQNRQQCIDSLVSVRCWIKDIVFNVNEIECKYITNQSSDAFNQYTLENPRQTQKKKLYEAYMDVFKNLMTEADNCTSFQSLYTCIKQLNGLCSYMSNGLSVKTSDLEKDLKAASDYKSRLACFEKYFTSNVN